MVNAPSTSVHKIIVAPNKNGSRIRRLIAGEFNHVPPDARLLSNSPEIVIHQVQSRCLIVLASEATGEIVDLISNGKHLPTNYPHVNLMIEIHGSAWGYLDVTTISLSGSPPYASVNLRAGERSHAMMTWRRAALSYHRATRWYPREDEIGGRLSPRDTHKLRKWLWSVLDAAGISR